MEQKIIDALKDEELQKGDHYIELDLGDNIVADMHYKLDYEITKTFDGNYYQPPEYECVDCKFDIVSLFISDDNKIYNNDDISIPKIENIMKEYLLTA